MKKKEKKETISDRVKRLRKTLKMNQTVFAEKIGLSDSALSRIEIGDNKLTNHNIILVCTPNRLKENCTVNEAWLRNGGDISLMFATETFVPLNERYANLKADERELMGIYDRLFDETKNNVRGYAREKLELQELRKNTEEKGERRMG